MSVSDSHIRAVRNRGISAPIQVDSDPNEILGTLVFASFPVLDEAGEQRVNNEGDLVFRRQLLDPQPTTEELAVARAQLEAEAAADAAEARERTRRERTQDLTRAIAAETDPAVRVILEQRLGEIAR